MAEKREKKMDGFSVHILGGCGIQTPERFWSDDTLEACIVLETPKALYLMDCGAQSLHLISEQFTGTRTKPIRGIFISHCDPDHIDGLWTLLARLVKNELGTALRKKDYKSECLVALPVVESILPRIRDSLALHAFPSKLQTGIRFEAMSEGYIFECEGFRLEVLPNQHQASLKTFPNLEFQPCLDYQPSFSFRAQYGGKTIIYSADYIGPDEISKWLQEGADLAILENGHTPPIEAYVDMLVKYDKLPTIALTHFWAPRGNPDDIVKVAKKKKTDTDWIKSTAGIEFRFDPDSRDSRPKVIPFSEKLKMRKPFHFPSQKEMREFCISRSIPMEWEIIGPFDNPYRDGDYRGLDQDYGVGQRPDYKKEFKGKNDQTVRWRPVQLREIRSSGAIDLHDLIGGEDCLAYAYTKFTVPKNASYEVLAGSDDGCRMWIDGKEIFYINQTKGAMADEYRIPISLSRGEHEVMIAIEQRFGGWMFFWRIVPVEKNLS